MTRPSVSVVIATRDRPELLREAVAAVQASRHDGRVEVIAVFDRSEPDASLASADENRPVQVVPNRRTPGLAGARNTGILAARSDLVAFCDDDDLWLPSKLLAQVEVLAHDPSVEVVTTGILVDAGGRLTPRVLDRDRITHADLLRSRVMEAHPSTYLTRRAALDGIGLVDEELPGSYAEDYDWLLRAARRHPVAAVRAPLVRVRWSRGSYFASRWETIDAALAHLVARHPELAAEPAGLARILGQRAFAQAALGRRSEARATARRVVELNPREQRAWLARLVAAGVPASVVVGALNRIGRGI
ncbi:MAG: glycosyltransferase family 2 protein [Actinobacteria bacterium]|nr:glycosyltransferase family 2 protein [Actinomycetota bacterium]